MVKPPRSADVESSLRALGIEEDEERVYRALLVHGSATVDELAASLGLSPRRAQDLLQRVEEQSLASHSPERPRRYIPARPELAVEALIRQRQAVLEQTRLAIPELKSLASRPVEHADGLELVELITSRPALGRTLEQLQQTVQGEIFAFQRAPELYPDGHQKAMPPHVRIRSISDSSYIGLPGAMDSLRRMVGIGEEARYCQVLPMKMVVWDRRIALVPLSVENQDGPALLVRGSSLLDALCALFDLTWERSTPIAFTLSDPSPDLAPRLRISKGAERVVPLLAAGLNDKLIAHEGGLSKTTLNRRIAELMQYFDARTRFQLGWRAALAAFPERVANGIAASGERRDDHR